MQRSIYIVLLPLFLIMLFGVSSVPCFHSDIGNSVLAKSASISNSVMAPKLVSRGTKRLLKQCVDEGHANEQGIEERRTKCNRVFVGGDQCDQIKSKRWKTTELCHVQIAEASNQSENVNGFEHCDEGFRRENQNSTAVVNESSFTITEVNTGECSFLFGQASYQRSKQGLTVKYEDSGDHVYTCDHCNASFWFGEALKRSSSNAPLIYTNCCKKGQIKIQQPKPMPAFLETLLDPNNGPESKLFRENIRVYKSMCSFTSMGTTIDCKINIGSGPYVFKISGQVHHLTGSLLPSYGESPKYAQMYIYV